MPAIPISGITQQITTNLSQSKLRNTIRKADSPYYASGFVTLLKGSRRKALNTAGTIFNGYFNGGDFRWSTVPSQYQNTLEFDERGGFKETRPEGCLPAQCLGTYRLLNDGEIQILSSCSATPYNLSMSVSNKVLTITHLVREGEDKEMFIKVE